MSEWLGKLTGALTLAGKGAAAGAMLGPVGAAAGGALGLAMDLLPGAAHLFGTDLETRNKVEAVVHAVTGTSDPVEQAAAVADPQVAADLRIQLSQIAADRQAAADQAQIDALKVATADIAGARAQTMQLANAGSTLAWGTPIVSAIVLLSFAIMCAVVLSRSIPEGSMPLAQGLLEVFKILAVTVVAYWCGSSAGSAQKSVQLANAVPASLIPQPAAVVPASDVQPVK